jgi:hypothetical protein
MRRMLSRLLRRYRAEYRLLYGMPFLDYPVSAVPPNHLLASRQLAFHRKYN